VARAPRAPVAEQKLFRGPINVGPMAQTGRVSQEASMHPAVPAQVSSDPGLAVLSPAGLTLSAPLK